jgi:hypothetical protein
MHRIHDTLPRRFLTAAALAGLVGLSGAGCDFLDPTDIDNPRTTPGDLADAAEPTAALLPGLRLGFASALENLVIDDAVVSDDYSVHGTGLNSDLDYPSRIVSTYIGSTYEDLQELRALGDFILEDIVPDDPTATGDQVATAHFYRGAAYLLMAEFFAAVPLEAGGPTVDDSQVLQRAISDLQAAQQGGDPIGTAASGLLARAYRDAGDVASARAAAQDVLGADAQVVWGVDYDAATQENDPYFFLVQRALQEMQPLPRLDFLDPKYLTRESMIPVVKAEEMHLILAEADMADGAWGAGRGHLVQAIQLARSRGTTSFEDEDPRFNANLSIRPRDAVIEVRADADSPYRSGLVLTRPGFVDAPTISDTSLDPDSIAAIPDTDMDALLHALYLARQEILLLEARRLVDLGIKLPISFTQIDVNPAIDNGDPGTVVVVPGYIPSGNTMDLYTPTDLYSPDDPPILVNTQVTITVDMNQVLVANRAPFSPAIN